MPRTGVRTLRRRSQTWYATIHSGIEDQVVEDQQESLQNYVRAASPFTYLDSKTPLSSISSIGEPSPIQQVRQFLQFQWFTIGAELAFPIAREWKCQEWNYWIPARTEGRRNISRTSSA